MADTAISFEAPELSLGGAVDEPDLETGSEADGAEGASSTEGADDAAATDDAAGKPFLAVENGKLSESAKKLIEGLKATDPKLAKGIQRALFAEDRLRKELPGGFKDLAALRQTVEGLGGTEGIESLRGELDGWKDFDAKYTAGDPKVLEFLTETPEAQEAFLKIAPAAFEKFREANPDGYAAYISQVFVADMQTEQLPMTIQLLGSVLSRATLSEADKAEATKLYASLTGYVNRIGEFAKKQVSAPAAAKAGADPRAAELDTREQSIRRTEWSNETGQQHGRIFSEAWQRLAAAAVPKEKVALVRRLYGMHLQEKLNGKKDFAPNMDRYFKAKQKDGFMRLHDSTFKEAVPLALRSAMAEAGIGARKAPAAAPKPGESPKPGAPPVKPAAGFVMGVKPAMSEVNNVLTRPEMWQNKQAILKNGTRRTWA